jgi:3,4-dihydroxy 2-butanone 4-phosphate synthase/GTP cyclohydrolase II
VNRRATAVLDPFTAGSPVLVGDPDDPVVFLATAAARVDGPALERLQELAGGMTVLALGDGRAAELGLAPLRVDRGQLGLALTAPVDAARGIRGGWSPRDRAHTIRVAADPQSRAADLTLPGHVHTARIGEGATVAAAAALELARRSGTAPAVVLGAITGRDGRPVTLAQADARPELRRLPHASSAQVRGEALSRRSGGRVFECALPTHAGDFRALALEDPATADEVHGSVVALVHGDPAGRARPLVHVHAACLLGDAFGSLLCDCRAELGAVTEAIIAAGAGVIVYVKPGTTDPKRRYHCGRGADVDLAPVLALLHGCGIDPGAPGGAAPPAPAGRWFTHRS